MQFSATALFVLLVSSTAVEAKKPKSYVGSIDVVRDPADANQVRRRLFTGGPDVVHSTNDGPIVGTVFEDLNMNSVFDADEPGVAVSDVDSWSVVLVFAKAVESNKIRIYAYLTSFCFCLPYLSRVSWSRMV